MDCVRLQAGDARAAAFASKLAPTEVGGGCPFCALLGMVSDWSFALGGFVQTCVPGDRACPKRVRFASAQKEPYKII